MAAVISMGELVTQIRALCDQLFPAGVVEGHEFRVGSLAGEPGTLLSPHARG